MVTASALFGLLGQAIFLDQLFEAAVDDRAGKPCARDEFVKAMHHPETPVP